MIRQAQLVLAVVAVVAAGACTGETPAPAPPRGEATPPPAAPRAQGPTIPVHVAVGEDPGPGIQAWARELEAAIAGGHGQLSLVEDAGDAQVVVRVDSVETGTTVTPAPPGEGEVTVMRGALVVGGLSRAFNLAYRGETRPQAEALARHLRVVATEGIPEPAATPAGDPPS